MSTLDEIEARIRDCKTYKFGMRNADTLAHFDAPFLLALVREQAAKLEAVRELADDASSQPGSELAPVKAIGGLIRAALESK